MIYDQWISDMLSERGFLWDKTNGFWVRTFTTGIKSNGKARQLILTILSTDIPSFYRMQWSINNRRSEVDMDMFSGYLSETYDLEYLLTRQAMLFINMFIINDFVDYTHSGFRKYRQAASIRHAKHSNAESAKIRADLTLSDYMEEINKIQANLPKY